MDTMLHMASETWQVTVAMAPYLLFGFLMSGVLSVLISKDYVQRHLGGHGLVPAIKAALFGVPMPVCSCGVIPLATALRRHGASRSATAAFLASTPQTGVDSLMITYALLGWVFAVFRAVVAFLSGVLCGAAVGAVSLHEPETPAEKAEDSRAPGAGHAVKRMLAYGFVTLPRHIARAVLLGILLSGVISGLIPDNYFADRLGDSPIAMLVMLLIGIPLYVCSSGSVPIALAFIKAGISPGAALVFLITGPATNAATLTTLWEIIGRKQLAVFLATLAASALAAGWIMNALPAVRTGLCETVCCHATSERWYDIPCAVLLLAVLARGLLPAKPKS